MLNRAEITDRIIIAMRNGTPPWKRPFATVSGTPKTTCHYAMTYHKCVIIASQSQLSERMP